VTKRVSPGLLVRNLLWTALAPGMVTGYLPYRIVFHWYPGDIPPWNEVRIFGVALILPGVVILVACIWRFAVSGKGTLSPLDAPRRLVTGGIYRYVRNPMYLAVMLILLGETLMFHSIPLAIYTALCFGFFNLLVLCYEEPALRRKFGEEYIRYCQTAGRWLPRK